MIAAPRIVPATLADAAAIARIYAHHVLHGTASWETEPPDAAEIAARLSKVLEAGWPWLVARSPDDAVIGYAYAAQYNPRAGYRWCCETSIYLRHDMLGRGIGTALLAALLEGCAAAGFRQAIAGISGGEAASRALHARAGYVEVGRLNGVGRKHGRWLDVLYMQRSLGEGSAIAPPGEGA